MRQQAKLSRFILNFQSKRSFFNLPASTFARPKMPSQPAITCSNLTIETLEQGVKYVQS